MRNEIENAKQELLLAKKILKDPTLSKMATLKFNNVIDKINEEKICKEGTLITDLLPT